MGQIFIIRLVIGVASLLALASGSAALADDAPGGPPDAGALAEVFRSNLAKIEDLQFVFEGDKGVVSDPAGRGQETTFQGTYAYRTRDSSILIDLYERSTDVRVPMQRSTYAMLAGRLETMSYVPDLDRKEATVGVQTSVPEALLRPMSPERFLMLNHLVRVFKDPVRYNLRAEGWEEVDGRRCLKIYTSNDPSPDRKLSYTLWLDPGRGALPLRTEDRFGDILRGRTHSVEIRSVDLPGGGSAWLPVGAVDDSFSSKTGEVPGRPFIRETNKVVLGSLRVNQGLRDDVFSARWDGKLAASSTPKGLREEFEAESKKARARRPKTDRASVEERLAGRLAEADAQAEELKASSPAREAWSSTAGWQAAIGGLAVAALAAGLWMRGHGR